MNPLIQREFFGILRSPKAFATLFILTAAFSLAVLMRWPADAKVDLSGAQSIGVFRVFGYGLLAGVIFLVPAFPASSIVKEKNQGTLALLLNSPLSPLSIYIGKLAGVLLFSLLVLLSSLPAAAACYAMGGVDLVGGLGLLYLILAMLVVQYATLGMMVSSFVQSTDSGVRLTYGIVLGLCFLTLLPLPEFAQGLRYCSPLPIIMQLMGHGSVASQGLQGDTGGTLEFVGLTFITWFVFGAITLSRLNYRIFDRARAQGVMTDDRVLLSRIFRRLFFVVDPQRRKSGIPWYLNPVMVKEFRCRRFGRSQWLMRLTAGCVVASMGLTFYGATRVEPWGVDKIGGLMVCLQVILVVVLTPSLTAGLISGERDSGGWELLRMTPISPFKIVRGKLLSVVWTLLLVLTATVPGYLVMMTFIKPDMLEQVNTVMICLALTAVYTLSISAVVGSLFRNTAVATTSAYVIVMAVFLIPMLVWLGRDAPFGHDTVQFALMINPVGAALSAIGAPEFSSYNLLPAAWWVAGAVSSFMFLVFGVQVWRLTRPV
jgi:ABC-type transport system involved in multi-copper enzyme maturation permease subunit